MSMGTAELVLWYGLALVGVAGSAMFSGLETGLYTVNRVRLHVRAHVPNSSAAVLEAMLRAPNRLLGTLLVGNNIVNYLASYALATLLVAAGYTGWAQVGINAAILTPVLFIFGEVLPKDLFRGHSDRLTVPFAKPLRWMQRALTVVGALPLIDLISHALGRLLRGQRETQIHMLHPRRIVTQLMKEGVGHGLISPYQSDMIDRVLQLGRRTAGDVMTPWREVTCARRSQPPEAIWSLADRVPHARLPLLDGSGAPAGVLTVFDVLRRDPAECPPLEEQARPVISVTPDTSCQEALLLLQREQRSMALVMDGATPRGLVTTKDLVEPIVGELESW